MFINEMSTGNRMDKLQSIHTMEPYVGIFSMKVSQLHAKKHYIEQNKPHRKDYTWNYSIYIHF